MRLWHGQQCVTGAAMLLAGGGILLSRHTRTMVAAVGGWLLALILVLYGPVMI